MRLVVIQWLRRGKVRVRDEGGVSLIESLVAVAILGIGVVATLAALSAGSLAVSTTNQQAMVQSLAQSQLEDIKAAPYAATYPVINELGYDISVDVDPIPDTDNNIQKITVTISQDGETLLVVEDFKVNR